MARGVRYGRAVRAVLPVLLLAAGCGGGSFVAIETGGAELRVVVTYAGTERGAIARSRPDVVCPGQRTKGCRWTLSCASATALCTRARLDTARERPDGTLELGSQSCTPIAATDRPRGASAAWTCAAGVCGDAEI